MAILSNDFESYQLQRYLKNLINSSPRYHYKLRVLANCGVVGDITNGVHVLSNGKESRILGVKMCGHSWACPACTARKMAKYSRRVGAAIEALAKQGLAAFMITFTIFHTKRQSCKESFDLLRNTWNKFDKAANWRRKRIVKGKNQINNVEGDYYKCNGVWANFKREFNIKHSIKALEVTYGEHGWHPHIHMIFFTEQHRLQEIAEWQNKLAKSWEEYEDREAKKLFKEKRYEIRKFLQSKDTRPDAQHQGLYISIDEKGKIKRFDSGDYICGWGGNNEITGGSRQMKVARGTNLTPLQILQLSYDLQKINPKKSSWYGRLFMHFANIMLTNRIHRIDFSRTGLNAIVQNYINSEGYKEQWKKKCENLKIPRYHTVAWFSLQTWYNLCWINDYKKGIPIIPLILRFATYENGYELISELFQVWNLPPPLRKHPKPNYDLADMLNERIAGIAA